MSIKKAIRDLIPPECDYVLRDNCVISIFVDLTYNALPDEYKNRFQYKRAIEIVKYRIKMMDLNNDVYYCIGYVPAQISKIDAAFWNMINRKIKEYKEQIR